MTNIIHWLDGGRALCAINVYGLPGDWPSGHSWTAKKSEVTCTRCKTGLAGHDPLAGMIPMDASGGRFLIATGLLFEINVHVLHKYGLAMAVDYTTGVITVQDHRGEEGGVIYDPVEYPAMSEKLIGYLHAEGKAKLVERVRMLGCLVQDRPDPLAGRCRLCGCTWFRPREGGCSWANAEHTLCTRCAELSRRKKR